MKHKKLVSCTAVFLLGLGSLHAQNNTVSAGGDATGTNGSSNYSVGQLLNNTNTGTNGSVTEGVQQPFNISILTSLNEFNQGIELSIYPNPTTNILNLEVKENKNLSFQLYDIQGTLLNADKVRNSITNISMENLSIGTYLLKLSNKNQVIQTFEIIKN